MAVISDDAVLSAKGPTILNCEERLRIIRACKWAKTVVMNDDYFVTEKTLDKHNA